MPGNHVPPTVTVMEQMRRDRNISYDRLSFLTGAQCTRETLRMICQSRHKNPEVSTKPGVIRALEGLFGLPFDELLKPAAKPEQQVAA